MKKYKYFCLAFMMATFSAGAQEVVPENLDNAHNKAEESDVKLRSVSGRVTSTMTQSPLAGALITVDYALNQGRDVYIAPYDEKKSCYFGNHKLYKDGAKIAYN